VLLTAALLADIVPLVLGRQAGRPWWFWASLVAAAILFPLFFVYQNRLKTRGGSPLVDPALWRERAFAAGLSAQTAFFLGQSSYFLFLALFLQKGMGMTALQAGGAFGILGAGYLVTSWLAPRVAAVWGRQTVALGGALRVVGLSLQAAGVVWGGDAAFAVVLAGMLIDGAGQGFGLAPLTSLILQRIPPAEIGAASGVLSTNMQVANALGVAVVGLLFYSAGTASGEAAAYVRGFPPAVTLAAGFEAALVVLVQLLPTRRAEEILQKS
jgi:predicted MFS family arabinose efflux permease